MQEFSGQVADERSVSRSGLVQLGSLAQGLVVGKEDRSRGLLHLEPVHSHLDTETQEGGGDDSPMG